MANSPQYLNHWLTHQQLSGYSSQQVEVAQPPVIAYGSMKFCTSCGDTVSLRVPKGDDKRRIVCDSCELVHYSNPKIVVGCIPRYFDSVLLCQRAIGPRIGYWTLPAGFMESGETTYQGAARETWEEAKARVSNLELYRVFDAPYCGQVLMIYRCDIEHGSFGVGAESLNTALFDEGNVPWREMAFPAVSKTLKEYFSDCRDGQFPIRASTLFDRPYDD